jgi:hypothetical protein
MVSDRVCLLPTVTLPKVRLDGFAASVPSAAFPVPDSDIVNAGFEAFEVIVTVPLAAPAACGANVTVKLALWDAFSVNGVLIPLS